MAENSVSHNMSIVNENGLVFVESNGQILFSSEEIGRQLGYKSPAKSINILFNRNQKELNGYAVGIKLMSTDGKFYEVRHFTEEGVYILSMLANTSHAARFRGKVTLVLRQVRENQMSLARESGYQQGFAEARALPAAEVERKAAYLDGLREGQRLQKRRDGLAVAARAADYLRKGLTLKDAAQLTGCPASTLRGRLRRIRVAAAALTARACIQQGVLA